MKKNILSIIMCAYLLAAACSYPHYYYSPNVQNVPLFKEREEFSFNLGGSVGAVDPSLEVQAAYALPGHIALMTNYMAGGTDNSPASYDDYSKNRYFEGGLGFYVPFREIGVFELYTGYGQGSQNHAFAYKEYQGKLIWNWVADGSADMSYTKFFIQPNIGIRTNWVDAALSVRLSALNFTEINIYNTVHRLQELNTLQQNNTPWLFEPALTCRLGKGSLKGQMQIVFSNDFSGSDLHFEKLRFNFGIYVDLLKKKTVNTDSDHQ
jgi:hypothetical protein